MICTRNDSKLPVLVRVVRYLLFLLVFFFCFFCFVVFLVFFNFVLKIRETCVCECELLLVYLVSEISRLLRLARNFLDEFTQNNFQVFNRFWCFFCKLRITTVLSFRISTLVYVISNQPPTRLSAIPANKQSKRNNKLIKINK